MSNGSFVKFVRFYHSEKKASLFLLMKAMVTKFHEIALGKFNILPPLLILPIIFSNLKKEISQEIFLVFGIWYFYMVIFMVIFYGYFFFANISKLPTNRT